VSDENSSGSQAAARYEKLLSQTRKRDAHLGEEDSRKLPQRLQQQLADLRSRLEAEGDEPEDPDRAEELLKELNRKLDEAFNLLAQLKGSRERAQLAAKRRLKAILITLAVLAAIGGGGLLYYRHARDAKAAECRQAAPCKQHGLCGAGLVLEPRHYAFECQAGSEEDCRQSGDCQSLGRCQLLHGKCAVDSDAECKKLPRCRSDGWCTAKNGQCVAASAADCKPSEGCRTYGRCSLRDGSCMALSDADCQQSQVCKRDGACIELQGQCVKTSDEAEGGPAKP